ncbi:MAG: hypothetical protein D6722_07635 [Bacteroidetes bacterium]|nr:MAG: hypothetical protein D6722_07635 [Bacteroidota bacterium]
MVIFGGMNSACTPWLFAIAGMWLACQAAPPSSIPPQAEGLPGLPLLLRDSSLIDHVAIDSGGIRLYASAADRAADRPEVIIYPDEYPLTAQLLRSLPWDSATNLCLRKGRDRWPRRFEAPPPMPAPSPDSSQPLRGLRVALDPGHIAANPETAEIEGKLVRIQASAATGGRPIAFNEAQLTLATARMVRDQLEALGAKVYLTRDAPGVGALGLTFATWKTEGTLDSLLDAAIAAGDLRPAEAHIWRYQTADKDLMARWFLPQDLKERARRIAAFRPHLTFIIHYNIHSPNWERRDGEHILPPGDANYSMAFVPGSFLPGELSASEDRIALLRLLLTPDLARSVRLSDHFIRASQQHTGVAPVDSSIRLVYLDKFSLPAGPAGVYARNLTLTRLIPGPLCYGESLCQDYLPEALALSVPDTVAGDLPAPRRVAEVAAAYVATARAYAARWF